jgi:hypothetical protein
LTLLHSTATLELNVTPPLALRETLEQNATPPLALRERRNRNRRQASRTEDTLLAVKGAQPVKSSKLQILARWSFSFLSASEKATSIVNATLLHKGSDENRREGNIRKRQDGKIFKANQQYDGKNINQHHDTHRLTSTRFDKASSEKL